MGKRAMLFVGMLLVAAAGTAQAKTASKTEVCANMAQLDANLDMARNPSPQMTVGQMKAMPDEIRSSYKTFIKSAETYAKPEAKKLDDSINQLKEHARKVPEGATLEQAKAALQPDFQQVASARDQLKATLNCPASPQMPSQMPPSPQPSQQPSQQPSPSPY